MAAKSLARKAPALFAFLCPLCVLCGSTSPAAQKPNVLFISIDDLNDWVGVFGGHPQAKTPHLDRFAQDGAIVFQNAFCAGPVCGPSRSALLSGFMPHTTGIYGNSQNMLESPLVQEHATLPEYFSKNGYRSLSRGKIFHRHATAKGADPGHWAFDVYEAPLGGSGVDKTKVTSRNKNLINGRPGPATTHTGSGGTEFAWGPTRDGVEKTKDYLTARWAAGELGKDHKQPFFMAVGLSKPHLPFYVPQEFFDLYDPKTTKANEIREDDLKDIVTPSGKPKHRPSDDYLWLKQNGLIDEAARAYLAACSYADACLGVIFEALKKSPHSENTIVMVWGDHGWHLGEKLRYRKATGWIESTRVPLLVRMPGMKGRQDCARNVNLIDFYPTLIELCNLPGKSLLDGRSFAPLLADPKAEWDHPALTIHGDGNASVTDGSWHYIRYREGTEEFYDLVNDPMEWSNLMRGELSAPALAAKERLEKAVPRKFAKGIPSQDAKAKAQFKKVKGLDNTIKARRPLAALK